MVLPEIFVISPTATTDGIILELITSISFPDFSS